MNGPRNSLEYGCRYRVEHFVSWAHVLYVAEVGRDLLTCVSARMNCHLAYIVQEPGGIADISIERGDRVRICLLRRKPIGGGGEVDDLPEGPAGGVAIASPSSSFAKLGLEAVAGRDDTHLQRGADEDERGAPAARLSASAGFVVQAARSPRAMIQRRRGKAELSGARRWIIAKVASWCFGSRSTSWGSHSSVTLLVARAAVENVSES